MKIFRGAAFGPSSGELPHDHPREKKKKKKKKKKKTKKRQFRRKALPYHPVLRCRRRNGNRPPRLDRSYFQSPRTKAHWRWRRRNDGFKHPETPSSYAGIDAFLDRRNILLDARNILDVMKTINGLSLANHTENVNPSSPVDTTPSHEARSWSSNVMSWIYTWMAYWWPTLLLKLSSAGGNIHLVLIILCCIIVGASANSGDDLGLDLESKGEAIAVGAVGAVAVVASCVVAGDRKRKRKRKRNPHADNSNLKGDDDNDAEESKGVPSESHTIALFTIISLFFITLTAHVLQPLMVVVVVKGRISNFLIAKSHSTFQEFKILAIRAISVPRCIHCLAFPNYFLSFTNPTRSYHPRMNCH